jgi:hypothetical protein
MAEEKKKDKKKDDKGKTESKPSYGLEITFWIVLVLGGLSFILGILGYGTDMDYFINNLSAFIGSLVEPAFYLCLFISLLLLIGIMYVSMAETKVMHHAEKKIEPKHEDRAKDVGSPLGTPNERWQRVISHIESENPADWRLAIIEADIILEEMLQKMGYKGAGVGDMLKTAERSDFTTLDYAWEAHKARNNIAHQGADFVMSHEEAKRIITLFRWVFEEFFYI